MFHVPHLQADYRKRASIVWDPNWCVYMSVCSLLKSRRRMKCSNNPHRISLCWWRCSSARILASQIRFDECGDDWSNDEEHHHHEIRINIAIRVENLRIEHCEGDAWFHVENFQNLNNAFCAAHKVKFFIPKTCAPALRIPDDVPSGSGYVSSAAISLRFFSIIRIFHYHNVIKRAFLAHAANKITKENSPNPTGRYPVMKKPSRPEVTYTTAM